MKITVENRPIDNGTWFKKWFDSAFYHQLYANRDENEAAGFIDGLICKLAPAPQARMLDLGCGNGRHSKRLSAKGFHVTGIDLAGASIRSAKKSESPNLRFYRGDMREPFGKNHFDHVFSFFTSFGYFKTNEEDHQVVANMAEALKPGGTLVLDYLNTPYAEKKLVPVENKEIDGIIYRITRWTDEKHFFKKIVIDGIIPGKPYEFTEQVSKFSLVDFNELFNAHGLCMQQVYGDYNLGLYDAENSPRLILVATKK